MDVAPYPEKLICASVREAKRQQPSGTVSTRTLIIVGKIAKNMAPTKLTSTNKAKAVDGSARSREHAKVVESSKWVDGFGRSRDRRRQLLLLTWWKDLEERVNQLFQLQT